MPRAVRGIVDTGRTSTVGGRTPWAASGALRLAAEAVEIKAAWLGHQDLEMVPALLHSPAGRVHGVHDVMEDQWLRSALPSVGRQKGEGILLGPGRR